MNLEIEIKVIPRMVSGIETSFRPERRTSGWLMDTLSCVKRIGRKTFTLSDMYAFEGELAQKYPNNRHIQAKIRQELQILRDYGIIEFVERGKYKMRRVRNGIMN